MGANTELLTQNGKANKGKIFRKTPHKKKVQKYLSLEQPLADRLEKISDLTNLSQSYIMAEALINYLDNLEKND